MHKIVVALFSCGRLEYVKRTWESFSGLVKFDQPYDLFVVDDFPDEATRQFLDTLPAIHKVYHPHNQGLASSVNDLQNFLTSSDYDYVFHLEDDFVFQREVKVQHMIQLLEHNPDIAQMRLTRQPIYDVEIAEGNIITCVPKMQVYKDLGYNVEQKEGFVKIWPLWSFNPNIAHVKHFKAVAQVQSKAENTFSRIVFSDKSLSAGYYGNIDDTNYVHHIGEVRKGSIF